jgi:hypothetical protein
MIYEIIGAVGGVTFICILMAPFIIGYYIISKM